MGHFLGGTQHFQTDPHDESCPWHLWLSETGSFLHGSAEVWRSPDCLRPLCAWRCRSHAKVFHPLENLDMSCHTHIYVYTYHICIYIYTYMYIHIYIYTYIIYQQQWKKMILKSDSPALSANPLWCHCYWTQLPRSHITQVSVARISWDFPSLSVDFQTKNGQPKSLENSHPERWHPTIRSQVAVPGLPVSRSREIRPGFTMTARHDVVSGRSGTTWAVLEGSRASTTQMEAKTLIFPSFLGLGCAVELSKT